MKIRTGIHLTRRAHGETPDLGEWLALAAICESAGIDGLWIAERPDDPDGLPSALPACAALAATTERIRLVTAVLALPLHHPLRVAEDAATIDGLSGGRLELGLGLGADPERLADFGVDRALRVARFEEATAVLRAAWSDGPLGAAGSDASSEIEVHPKPLQPGGPPLWLGAATEGGQRRAARLGLGLLSSPELGAAAYLDAWCESGRAPEAARIAWLAGDGTAPASLAGGLPEPFPGELHWVLPAPTVDEGEAFCARLVETCGRIG